MSEVKRSFVFMTALYTDFGDDKGLDYRLFRLSKRAMQ